MGWRVSLFSCNFVNHCILVEVYHKEKNLAVRYLMYMLFKPSLYVNNVLVMRWKAIK